MPMLECVKYTWDKQISESLAIAQIKHLLISTILLFFLLLLNGTLKFKISTSNSFRTLLHDILLNSTSLGKSNLGLVSSSDSEHVHKTGTERISLGISNGSNGE